MAMEYVHGGDLFEILRKERRFSPHRAAKYSLQLATVRLTASTCLESIRGEGVYVYYMHVFRCMHVSMDALICMYVNLL